MSLPWAKLLRSDWDRVEVCTDKTKIFYVRCAFFLSECEDRGFFRTNGIPWPKEKIARAIRGDEAGNLSGLDELLQEGIAMQSKDGTVYFPALVREAEKARKCSEAAKRGGGNPNLKGHLKGLSKGPPKVDSKGDPKVASLSYSSSTTESTPGALRNLQEQCVFSEKGKRSEFYGSPKNERLREFDELWLAFRKKSSERGVLDGSDVDWRDAGREWDRLDPEQKMDAVADVATRAVNSPEMNGLPQTYLNSHKWQRGKKAAVARANFAYPPELPPD